ncbi:hypothetical protein PFLG_01637 [Plasmodium falciparum RAJ116]|uniref:Uncharacterized protein n=1 Tax=Plasmodium falciparum RAJ116 TaxID=580058 RepID=A0A0L0CXL6_PLAFA|nr:hypothetical protein PFLG_01637 [Plasmodium falciparum RAJ116]
MENNNILEEPEGVNLYNGKIKNMSNENTVNYMVRENNYFEDTRVQIKKKNLLERSSKLCTVENRIRNVRNIPNDEKLLVEGNSSDTFVDSSIGFKHMYINNVQSACFEKREVNHLDINQNNGNNDNKEKNMNMVDNNNNNCKIYNDHHLNINNQNYYNKNMNCFNNNNSNSLEILNENKNFMYTQDMNISQEKNECVLNGGNKKEVDFYLNEEEQDNMINQIMSYEHFTDDNNINNNNNNNNNYNNNNVRNICIHKNEDDCNNFISVENNNMGQANGKISPSLDNKMYAFKNTVEYDKDMKKSINPHCVINKENDIIGSLKKKLEDQNVMGEEKNINNSTNCCITSDNTWNNDYEMKLVNNKLNDMNDSSFLSNNLKENLKYSFNKFNSFNDMCINDISKNVERDIFMNSHHSNNLQSKNGSPDNKNNKNKVMMNIIHMKKIIIMMREGGMFLIL